jgi:cyclic-di-GMP phosphodiesterase TipF (flagellum assembly factor)
MPPLPSTSPLASQPLTAEQFFHSGETEREPFSPAIGQAGVTQGQALASTGETAEGISMAPEIEPGMTAAGDPVWEETGAVADERPVGAPVTGNQATEDEKLLAAINDAIEADRIELYLQPIVNLPDRELTYYEAFSRLRNELGQVIAPKDFLPLAELAGLTPIIDNQIILRVIQVVQRLVERGKGRLVFCNLSLSSLRDAEFFAEFMDFMEANQWLSEHLVFELTQEALEDAGAYERERMAAIVRLGFRFSLDQITRLDIDFKALAEQNFAFIKVHASLLLGSMDGSKTEIHSADLSHYLKRLNITMIVDMVEREAVVRQLRDYNVSYVQGILFCEPKPVRPEIFDNQSIVAA